MEGSATGLVAGCGPDCNRPGVTREEDTMSVFGNIMSAVFGQKDAATSAAKPVALSSTPAPGPTAAGTAAAGTVAAATTAAAGATTAKPISRAEVEAMIQQIAASKGEQYNWRQSIVDLMKLLGLDSSLNARKQLAQELGYKGELNGSAEMNIWLHQQVMTKLAEGGGKVPDSLRHA